MKNISLVLGGGGIKGFIHLGVYKYITERGWNINHIAGTSMGAIMGAAIAAGKSFDDIHAFAKSINYTDIIDIDLKSGLIKGDKLMNLLKDYLGDPLFKQFSIPLKIIATDIDSGEEVVYNTGSVIASLHKSIAIPGIFSVQQDITKEQYLVDGGLVNNLPVNHVPTSDTDAVIAVSCMGRAPFQHTSSKTILGVEINTTGLTFHKRVLVRALNIMMTRNEDTLLTQNPQVILIRPDIDHIGLLSLDDIDAAIAIGYEQAKSALCTV